MDWEIFLGVSWVLLACFSFVLLHGAPYLPTLKAQVAAALELADLKPGDTVIELGCGDGRVLLAAARAGINSIGYELNPLMFLVSWLRTLPYRQQVKVIWGDFWRQDWPAVDAIYVFLLPRLMPRLDKKITSEKFGSTKVVSFAFKFPKRKAVAEKKGVFLYDFKV